MNLSIHETITPESSQSATEARPGAPRFASSFATVLGGQIACAAAALGIEICYARLIGPTGRGQIGVCMMVISIGLAVAGLGGEVPILIWAASQRKTLDAWLPAVWFWGLIGCVTFSCFWTTLYWKWHPSFLQGVTPTLAYLVLAVVPPYVFFQFLLALLTGLERFRERAAISLVAQVVELGTVVILALVVARTAEMAIVGNLAGIVIAGCVGAILLRHSLRHGWRLGPAANRLGASLSLGMRGVSSNLAMFATYRLDVFVVNYFLSPAQVGFYALGVVISESLWQIPQAVAVALAPRTARTIDEGGEQFTCFVTRQVFLLACGMAGIMALTSPIVIPLIFGARFRPSVPVIWWILPGTVAFAVAKVMAADLTARGKPEYNSMIAIASAALTVLLDFALIPRMGIRGAALASSITYFLQAIMIGVALKSVIKASWKSLLVPSYSELVHYRDAARRCKAWLASAILPDNRI
ncbi:MAG: oligosaccharide flippase family protein [Candidatus Acidiferrales bacterium]|jgi:O-antigen/teichoic acid export membrane protein